MIDPQELKVGLRVYDGVTGERAEVCWVDGRRLSLFLMESKIPVYRWPYQINRTQPPTRDCVQKLLDKVQPHNLEGVECLQYLPPRQAAKVAKAAYCVDLPIATVAAEMGILVDKNGVCGARSRPKPPN